MKYELTEEQFDNLRVTIARLAGVIESDQGYFAGKGWHRHAALLGDYVKQANDTLRATTYYNVKRVD
jgi:hypothetical protein